jgi:uncharacterized protein YuzE
MKITYDHEAGCMYLTLRHRCRSIETIELIPDCVVLIDIAQDGLPFGVERITKQGVDVKVAELVDIGFSHYDAQCAVRALAMDFTNWPRC